MFSDQLIQNNWPLIKTQVLNKWSRLSENEVERTHGAPKDLGILVRKRYGKSEDFEKAYEKICRHCTHSSKNPMDENLHGDSPERRLNANFAKVDHHPNINRETDDELSAYSPAKRSSLDDPSIDEHYNKIDDDIETALTNNEPYTHFTSPDDFTYSHYPGAAKDIPLGRHRSSATKISTAKAAPNSSAVSFDDTKKKM